KGDLPGLTVLGDFRDFNYFRDVNLELLHFGIEVHTHYMGLVVSALAHDLPWGLTALYNLIRSMLCSLLGEDNPRIFCVNSTSIDRHVEPSQRPHFLNGTMSCVKHVPQNALPFFELIQQLENEIVIEPENALKMHDYMHKILSNLV